MVRIVAYGKLPKADPVRRRGLRRRARRPLVGRGAVQITPRCWHNLGGFRGTVKLTDLVSNQRLGHSLSC